MPDNYLGHDDVGHRCCHSRMGEIEELTRH